MNKVLLFRALLATKFKYISGINDNFFSTFLFMVNVGFTFGSHFGLFFLGSLGSEQRLIGVRKEQRPLRDYFINYKGSLGLSRKHTFGEL